MLRIKDQDGNSYFECDLCKLRVDNPDAIGPQAAPIRYMPPEQPEWLLYALTLPLGSNPHTMTSTNYVNFHVCPACSDIPFSELIQRLPYDAVADRRRLLGEGS